MQRSVVAGLKRVYASGAQATGRVLGRVGLLPDEPPPRSRRLRHWAYSLTRAHDSLGIAELDVPWWTYGAIDAVEKWLDERRAGDGTRPLRAFEWGSGASTIWLAKRLDEVWSVEHHGEFGEMIRGELVGVPNATLSIVEPVASDAPAIASDKEGHAGLDFTAYVDHIDAVGGPFDLVVVDGRARGACLAAAMSHLADRGIVVFDNSMRRRYRAAIVASGLAEKIYRGLTPTLPYPDQTSILMR